MAGGDLVLAQFCVLLQVAIGCLKTDPHTERVAIARMDPRLIGGAGINTAISIRFLVMLFARVTIALPALTVALALAVVAAAERVSWRQ
ncbi:hypothetical protein DC522_04760 [Microvirga sp. KLBC 81]|nr:hypothetical protein DC522_04760 [Microvirga sp. KLBC 81]